MSADGGRDIQQGLIDYVANFTTVGFGKKFTIGVAPETYLNEMLAEPFPAFTFSPVGASVYQLGSFGAPRKALLADALGPGHRDEQLQSSKGHGLDDELCALVHHRSLVASSLYEQVDNLALVDGVWTGMALAPLRWKRAKIHRGSRR